MAHDEDPGKPSAQGPPSSWTQASSAPPKAANVAWNSPPVDQASRGFLDHSSETAGETRLWRQQEVQVWSIGAWELSSECPEDTIA